MFTRGNVAEIQRNLPPAGAILILFLALALQIPSAIIDSAVNTAIDRGVFPGAVVVVGTGSEILYSRGYGHFTWDDDSSIPDPDSTLFDLASLTKVVATTPAVMRLVEMQLLDTADRVAGYLPGFVGAGKEFVTVRQLLEHRSGLRAFLPLNERADSAAQARELVLTEPLRWTPGSRVEYSDLNAMLLGWVVEAVAGVPLDEFARNAVFDPLGMSQTHFRVNRSERARTLPVGLWRGHVIAGEIHDQNAAILGGVSGHAGLYSTGSDLARYARALLNRGELDGRRVFGRLTVDAFTRRGAGNRALGWEMRDPESTGHTGALLSTRAYGHGGFTGTSIWIDPELDVFVVILTNRVFAPRVRNSISALREMRGVVADAAVLLRVGDCAAIDVVVQGSEGLCRR